MTRDTVSVQMKGDVCFWCRIGTAAALLNAPKPWFPAGVEALPCGCGQCVGVLGCHTTWGPPGIWSPEAKNVESCAVQQGHPTGRERESLPPRATPPHVTPADLSLVPLGCFPTTCSYGTNALSTLTVSSHLVLSSQSMASLAGPGFLQTA